MKGETMPLPENVREAIGDYDAAAHSCGLEWPGSKKCLDSRADLESAIQAAIDEAPPKSAGESVEGAMENLRQAAFSLGRTENGALAVDRAMADLRIAAAAEKQQAVEEAVEEVRNRPPRPVS
jgi:hypothetical protein